MEGKEVYVSSKGQRTLNRALKDLRVLVETNPDPVTQRIAYAMETAIHWATRKTVKWQEPAYEACALANMLHDELKRHRGDKSE